MSQDPDVTSDYKDALMKALEQNWLHARHQEVQRQQQLFIFLAITGVMLTIISQTYIAWQSTLKQFWLAFLFLMIFSHMVSSSFIKWNLEFSNHIAGVQWISERLKLIGPISNEREQNVLDFKHFRTHKDQDRLKKKLLNDAMFQGYMALPLPLPKRVHQNFEILIRFILLATSIAFMSGLVLWISALLISGFSALGYPLVWISALPSSISNLPVDEIAAIALGLVFGWYIIRWDKMTNEYMSENASKLLDIRQPSKTSLTYRRGTPFFKKSEEELKEPVVEYHEELPLSIFEKIYRRISRMLKQVIATYWY